MHDAGFAVPGDLASPTGGYAYARALIATMPEVGWHLRHLALPDGFPAPDDAALTATAAVLQGQPPDQPLLIDGLAFGVLSPEILAGASSPLVALVHHPLALETGLAPERAQALATSERRALAAAAAVVCTSAETARVLTADYAVPADRIAVALPGTHLPACPAAGGGGEPHLLSVGTISPRKGQETLVGALALIADLPWRCRLVGSTTREPAAAARLAGLIAELGLQDRLEMTGEMPAETLQDVYAAADLFVLPSRYEGYGMAFAEALAHGLPIVACPCGAVPDTVPQAAALFVPPDQPAALAEALRRLLVDASLRQKKAAAAWQSGRRLPSWQGAAAAVAAALAKASNG